MWLNLLLGNLSSTVNFSFFFSKYLKCLFCNVSSFFSIKNKSCWMWQSHLMSVLHETFMASAFVLWQVFPHGEASEPERFSTVSYFGFLWRCLKEESIFFSADLCCILLSLIACSQCCAYCSCWWLTAGMQNSTCSGFAQRNESLFYFEGGKNTKQCLCLP